MQRNHYVLMAGFGCAPCIYVWLQPLCWTWQLLAAELHRAPGAAAATCCPVLVAACNALCAQLAAQSLSN